MNTITALNNSVDALSAAASYNNAAVGTGKTITVVYSLSGANAANYLAPASYTVTTGAIIAAQLAIGDPVVTLEETLDGDTSIVVTPGLLAGIVQGEAVTVSAAAEYNALSPDKVRPLNVVYTLTGADSANYMAPAINTNYMVYVQYNVNMGTVIDLIIISKVYDGTSLAVALAGSRIGACPGDDVTVNASGTYNDKKVGINKAITVSYTLSGDEEEVENYSPPASFTVNTGIITAKQLTIAHPRQT